VNQIKELAREKDCQPSQLALAWILSHGDDIVPIPGTKRIQYLEENIGALKIQLSKEDLRRINEVAPKGVAAGERYPDMSSVNL
jgi:aryl-alcohol dehydrogenase-like predicted oxidoreductase